MKISKNIGWLDRCVRLFLSGVFFLLAFFWTYGVLQVVLYVLAALMLVTTVVGSCCVYKLLKVNTCPAGEKQVSHVARGIPALVFVVALLLGSYGSMFFSKKFFLEDYNRMNQFYKQTLFYTGQNNRTEAVTNYTQLVTEYDVFYKKYSQYQPYAIKKDAQFTTDIARVKDLIASLQNDVTSGDLPATHTKLEAVRPVFQDILKRNGFSMLAVYLVDFHDVMEKVIAAADSKDASKVLAVYPEVNTSLQAVEAVADDVEMQTIRQKLEQVVASARSGAVDVLPSQGAELKSAFVKVYLKRG